MGTSSTKLVVVEFGMPISEVANYKFWLPDAMKDSDVHIEHVARWKLWPTPNEHLGSFIAFISEEDASYMLLRYPEMKSQTHIWPPAGDSELFRNFDK